MVESVATFCPWCELVTNSNVGKRSAHHDLMITTSTTKRIEVALFDTSFDQPRSSRSISWERPCRRDMVGCDGVTKFQQHLCIVDRFDRVGFSREVLEERWQSDVGRCFVPWIQRTWFRWNGIPPWLVHGISVALLEHLWRNGCACFNDFIRRWPKVGEHDWRTIRSCTDWFCCEIDLERSCQSIGNNKRR